MLRALTIASALTFSTAALAQEVNIYSSRQLDLIEPVLDAFTAETGIETNVLFLKKGLIDRIAAEGKGTPADIILMTDIGNLLAATKEGITQPVVSDVLTANIPAAYRDQENEWFGLTLRGRVVYASVDRVSEDSLTYEDLADPKYKGRICTRSGQHQYNIALFASIIDELGEAAAQAWLEGLRDNLARKPEGNDRAQAKGIYSGQCDLGLGNTYYVGLMETNEKEPEQKDWRKAIKVIFPNANGRGTHMNVSGMAMVKNSRNTEEALALMEFLSSASAQAIYAEQVFEYPVLPGAAVSDIVASFGELNADPRDLNAIGDLRARASELVDIVGYNDGPR
ncbi:MAG: extracellular solute-binding protein [Alphaproteobacteria bacterium]